MPTARKKLQEIAVVLFQQELDAWPPADVLAFVKDNVAAHDWSRSAKDRRMKQQIYLFLKVVASDLDLFDARRNTHH